MKANIKLKEYEYTKEVIVTRLGNSYNMYEIKGVRTTYYTLPYMNCENRYYIVNSKAKEAQCFKGVVLFENENGKLQAI